MNRPLPQTLEKAGGQRGSALWGPLLRGKKGAPSGVVPRGPGLHWGLRPSSEHCPHLSTDARSLCSSFDGHLPAFRELLFLLLEQTWSTPAGRVNEPILVNREAIGHGARPSVTWAPPPRVNVHENFMAASRLLKRAPHTWHLSLPCFDFSCAPK